MFNDRHDERGAIPEADALGQSSAVMRQSHREAQHVEFGAMFGGDFIKDRLFAVDLGFDGSLCFAGRNGIAEFEQAAQSARNGAPLFAVVAANAADGANRDTVLSPCARSEG